MARSITLRQVEAFRALVETGSVSEAAKALHVSQPAVSKLIANFEEDTALELFTRVRGRLVLTVRGVRLYEEVERIFLGLHQIENAIDEIRREEQERLVVGVIPALSGDFLQRVVFGFKREHPDVFLSLAVRGSEILTNWVANRQVDVGLVSRSIETQILETQTIIQRPLVCVMPPGHPLSEKSVIMPKDLKDQPIVSLSPSYKARRIVDSILGEEGITANVVIEATLWPVICGLVANGFGVTLAHPLVVADVRDQVVVRPFEPVTPAGFLVCRIRDSGRSNLIDIFLQEVEKVSEAVVQEVLSQPLVNRH